ncbi:Rrf2 family transcriptional regulator [candidate division TA06 bacterium]|uniref:Rrf2 family transcriptional regulator n=1 Tax=candidate division TA06 bacterium TaxID=2250710 RepID=A0A523XW85_UNCT6|nr:MAG: Rrf2 family transcriptional regulator [candidate division TA06 bacterium]
MKLSTKGRYAVRAMGDVAMHYGEAPVILREVAERQGISVHYLENIFMRLAAAGLVRSIRGAQGGFTLAKPPSEIRLSQIVKALEGPIAPVQCVESPTTCERASSCATRDIWVEMGAAMSKVLESVSLQDLAEQQRKKEQPEAPIYYI